MNAEKLLGYTEIAYHDLKTATDCLYRIWESHFGYTKAPESFAYDYGEISIQLRCAWLALDAAVRELAAVHGHSDDYDINKAVLTIQRVREVMGKEIEV